MSVINREDLVALIREATENVFETMLAQPVAAGPDYVDSGTSNSSNGVVSFIGLAGTWVGTGSISCSSACACQLASALLMGEYAAVDDDVLDAVAEVTNMILGNVKTSLEERLGPMGLSIPTVIYGRNFCSKTLGKKEWIVVPFETNGERMEVQLCLTEQRVAERTRIGVAGTAAVQV